MRNPERRYVGVGKCLTAFAAAYSISLGFNGAMILTANSNKIPFYLNLGAIKESNRKMIFSEEESHILAQTLLFEGVKWWEVFEVPY